MSERFALVTGAYGGLGSELCRRLGAAGIGCILVDRDLEKSRAFMATLNAERAGTAVAAYAVDLANHADIRRCTAEIRDAFPVLHHLFNNAGVLTETLQFSTYGTELHFEVNALAPLQLIDGLRPSLAAATGATVVNTSAGISLNAKTLDWDDLVRPAAFSKLFGPYVKSKAALNVFTAALARELAGDGIGLRAADPGPTRTKLTQGAGTPLWMRIFAPLLPTAEKNARKLYDAAFASHWQGSSGIFITGGKAKPLPPALADPRFQDDLVRRARQRVQD